MLFKLQGAMEFLMTYGWSLLIIAVVIAALFAFGVFNANPSSSRVPPGSCKVSRPSGAGTTANINLIGICNARQPQYVAAFRTSSAKVTIQPSASLGIAPSNQITITGWINPSTCTYSLNIGYIFSLSSSVGQEVWISNQCKIAFRPSSSSSTATYQSAIPLNIWSFFAATYDGTTVSIYINGGTPSTNAITTSASFLSNPTIIGALTGPPAVINGLLTNIQVYNTSLSASDIQTLYNKGMAGAPQNLLSLVGWWPLNGDANDYSGNNNQGTPTGIIFTSSWS